MQYLWVGAGVRQGAPTHLSLEVACPAVGHGARILVPRTATLAELKAEACAELFVAENEVELWDMWQGRSYACLEGRLHSSLADARIMDRQTVLLKARGDRGALSPAAFINNAWSKVPDVMLVFDDGSQLPAHRYILELSSPLLQDVLAQGPATGDARRDCTTSEPAAEPPALPSHQSCPVPVGPVTLPTVHHPLPAPPPVLQHSNSVGSAMGRPPSPSTPTLHPTPMHTGLPEQRTLPHRVSAPMTVDGTASSSGELVAKKQPGQSAQGSSACSGAETPPDMYVLRVPSDEWYSWVWCLSLLYPATQLRRPPVTWHNVRRIIALADKWMIACVLRLCQEFLMLPSTQFSPHASSPAYVWWWLMAADRLNMPMVVRKAVAAIQMYNVSGGGERSALEASVREVVATCSQATVAQLITGLCVYKDERLGVPASGKGV